MPLSEHEQSILDALERDLGGSASYSSPERVASKRSPQKLVLSVLVVVIGLAVVLTGVMVNLPIVGILGFAVMVGGVLWFVLAGTEASPAKAKSSSSPEVSPGKASSSAKKSSESFAEKMENRLRERREGEGKL